MIKNIKSEESKGKNETTWNKENQKRKKEV